MRPILLLLKRRAVIAALLFAPFWAIGQCTATQAAVDTYIYTQTDFGQSFRACATGDLTRLEVPMHNFLSGDIPVEISIYPGEGYALDPLYVGQHTLTDEWGSFSTFVPDSAVGVLLDETYTYRIDFLGEFGVVWARFVDEYADGALFWNGLAQSDVDMGFAIDITPAESPCMVWSGAVNEEWHEPGNWSPEGIPDSTTCVTIGVGAMGNSPWIEANASVASIVVEPQALLTLTYEASLDVYGDLDVQGLALFDGKVTMQNAGGTHEILGAPGFRELAIRGTYYCSEPLEIYDLLDLDGGYLANLGSEIYLHTGGAYKGHIYAPQDAIAGPVIIKRHVNSTSAHTVGLPFTDITTSIFLDHNADVVLTTFSGGESLADTAIFWPQLEADDVINGSSFAMVANGPADVLEIAGQMSLDDINIQSSDRQDSLVFISNPYPSQIDWSQINHDMDQVPAIYRWSEENQQFGVKVADMQTLGTHDRLAPSDAMLVALPRDEEIRFAYSEMVLRPDEIYDVLTESHPDMHTIRLQVTTDLGRDEMLIALYGTIDTDRPLVRAGKVKSLNDEVPTIGAIDGNNNIMTIESMRGIQVGQAIPLHVDAGESTTGITISPMLIDVAGASVYLEDRYLEVFHDLSIDGAYQVGGEELADHQRFILHYGSIPADPVGGAGALTTTDLLKDWSVASYGPDLVISDLENTWMLRQGQQLTTDEQEDAEAITQVQVHSAEGKLVMQQAIQPSTAQSTFRLYVTPGIYTVSIAKGKARQYSKVWID